MAIAENNKQQFRVPTFNVGQYSSSEASVIPQGAAELIENGLINRLGKVTQVSGTTRVGDNPDTLISRWTFDAGSSADDKASNDGSDTSITYVDGKFGRCAEFNGSDSAISVGADSTIDITSTGPFRISAWVYVDTDGENDEGRIVDKFSGTDVGFRFWVHSESSSTVKLSFEVGYDTTNALVVTSTTMSTGAWHRVDAVLNSDNSADIYIDGALASYSTDTTGVGSVNDDSAVDLIIGNNSAGSRTFDGKIDDVRFYDGTFAAADIAMDKVQGLTRYRVSGTIDRLYRIINTSLQYLTDNFKTWTDIDTGFTADKPTEFVQAKDILFILNNTDNVHTMNSSQTVTDEGNTNADPPRSKTGVYMPNNRLFLADNDTVYFSDVLQPTVFDRAVNRFPVRQGTQDKVTVIRQFRRNEIVIYKEYSIFMLRDTNLPDPLDWSLEIINPHIGCRAGNTVANLGDEHIYLATDGVRLLSRSEFDVVKNSVISDPIKDVIDSINTDQLDSACAYFHDGRYVLSFPTGTNTENNVTVIWDSQAAKLAGRPDAGWTVIPDGNIYPSAFAEFDFSDNKVALVFGDNRDVSLVHRLFNGNVFDGKAITMKVRSFQHAVDYVRDGIWGPVHVVADSDDETTILVRASVDGVTFEDLGTMELERGGGVNLPVNIPFSFSLTGGKPRERFHAKQCGRSETFQLEFIHNEYNTSVTLNEYSGFVDVRG